MIGPVKMRMSARPSTWRLLNNRPRLIDDDTGPAAAAAGFKAMSAMRALSGNVAIHGNSQSNAIADGMTKPTLPQAAASCERVSSKNVKLLCDLYHLQIMNGDLAQNLRDSIQWIAHFHAAGVPSRNELDGTQEVNWRYVASVIADLKYDGYLSHEWRPTPGRDPLQSIAQCLDIMDV